MANLYLYKITNNLNKKEYYGITSMPRIRFKAHMKADSSCTKLRNAVLKYGAENFSFYILCYGEELYIKELEIKCITHFDSIENGYNIILGNPRDGNFKLSEKQKQEISKRLVEYNKDRVSPNLGRKHSSKINDKPIYIMGFWFPNHRTAISSLNINRKSLYRWLKNENAGDEIRPQKKSKIYQPCYISGIWFPNMIVASDSLSLSVKLIQERIRNGNIEAKDKRAKIIYSEV